MNNIIYVFAGKLPSKAASSVHVAKMCSALAKDNNVTLITFSDDKKSIFHHYKLENIFKLKTLKPLSFRRSETLLFIYAIFYAGLRRSNVIFTRDLLMAYVSSVIGLRTIFEFHNIGFVNSKLNRYFFRKLQKNKNLVINVVITNKLMEDSINFLNVKSDRIIVLPDAADKVDFKTKIDIEYDSVGYVGSFYRGKGVDTVIKLARKMGNLKFHIVGGAENDINEMRKKSPSNVIFHGYLNQEEVDKLISKFHICLLPNKKTVYGAGNTNNNVDIGKYTSPLKLFQYMSFGKKIICSDLPVIREIVSEDNVWLAEPNDIDYWEKMINEAIKDTTGVKENKIKELFNSKFTWKVRAEKINEILKYKYDR
ncbi:glycosyltransferase [Photobacterium leiognathi]|uniref:glycosyltransferase n=1 Tax=Photobacterium leiognathi TaxID=553611 RepID=UPI002981B6DB|nr:glycosyltransferase [Photobacterium leiognathi]